MPWEALGFQVPFAAGPPPQMKILLDCCIRYCEV